MEHSELSSQETRHSRRIACVLRHHPEQIGIRLDPHGWADVKEMLQALAAHGTDCSMQELERIVLYNDKKRFAFNEDKTKIRARQGHSIPVDVELKKAVPPVVLYHGTIEPNRKSIEKKGLLPMNRLYVHLSPDIETARRQYPDLCRGCQGQAARRLHVFPVGKWRLAYAAGKAYLLKGAGIHGRLSP